MPGSVTAGAFFSWTDNGGSGLGKGGANSAITLQYVPDAPTVKFTAAPTNGPVPLTVRFNAATNDSGGSTITSWAWDFGDNATSNLQNPTHTYQRPGLFPLSLLCTNEGTNMVQGLGPTNIQVSGPTIPYTFNPTNGLAPLSVAFTASPNGNTITNWHWDFGDGATTNIQNPSHTYTNGSNYVVQLTAIASNGTALFGLGPNPVAVKAPTIKFQAVPTNGYMPLVVTFGCDKADSGGNGIDGYNWDFGDGSLHSTSFAPEHTYMATNSKTYSPKLTVTNFWGTVLKATGPKISAVYPPIPFTASQTNGDVPLLVQFGAPKADALGVPITNWVWKFGDGASSHLQNPAHTYTNIGAFAPALTATNINKTAVAGLGPKISAGWAQPYCFGASLSSGYDTNSNAITNLDGTQPRAGLALANQRLYGTMSAGGNSGSGTIFAVNSDGSAFTNLHQFSALPLDLQTNLDGARPLARLLLSGDALYGTTSAGGAGGGTVFRLQTDGSGFTNLHSFGYASGDGAQPNGLLLSSNTLYGSASVGGTNGSGTIFSVNTDGSGFTVLYAIGPQTFDVTNSSNIDPDGSDLLSPLVLAGNVLYGTAQQGGTDGGGTVFKLNIDGSGFAVLHNFTTNDGVMPEGDLALDGETLYGTTYSGGAGSNGTIFRVNIDGTGFAPLYAFSTAAYGPSQGAYTNADGANPSGGLLLAAGTLYGATQNGGAGGSGTVFAINTDGTGFANLYSFSALFYNSDAGASTNLDGANPYGGLALADGYLYGTACNGGSAGAGTIFAVAVPATGPPAPGPPLNIRFVGTNVLVSWPSSATGWTLQQCGDLAAGNWSPCPGTISDNGTNQSVSLTPAAASLFFRLAQ
jgi:uncharacterized repeat protein (TIGR03803 family)